MAVVRWLTLFANWLLRWPITGLNTAALFCTFVVLGREKLIQIEAVRPYIPDLHLSIPVGIVLLAAAALSFWIAREQEHRNIALSDIAKSTSLASILLFALVAIGSAIYREQTADTFAPFLAVTALITFGFWFVWNHAVVAAIAVLTFLSMKRLAWRGTAKEGSLMRPAAALALTNLQGVIWKIVIPALWLLLFLSLAPDLGGEVKCPTETQWYDAKCILKGINGDLFNVIVFNIATILILALGFFGVAAWRVIVRRVRRRSEMAEVKQPRLIVSPAIIALLFALALVNFYSFYAVVYQKALAQVGVTFDLPFQPYKFVGNYISFSSFLDALTFLGGATAALFLLFRIFGAAQNASRGIVHIARDIVDHQYTPRTAAARLWRAVTPKSKVSHPRRDRIEHRLDALMKEVVTEQRFDRLVFVAHSQGTLILYDYLISGRDNESIKSVNRIDVVTLGSPLTHLYRYYFDDYDKVFAPEVLHDRLASWTNLWRIDDPIGQKVDMFIDGFTKNEVLPKGGHVDYWREPRVLKLVLELIDPSRAVEEDAPVEPGKSTAAA